MKFLGFFKKALKDYNDTNLIVKILCGMLVGIFCALVLNKTFHVKYFDIGILGTIFVEALKAIAPILVFVLVSSSLASGDSKLDSRFVMVIFFYLLSTFLAAVSAVVLSFIFPQKLILQLASKVDKAPDNLSAVLSNIIFSMIQNPINAIIKGQYLGILFWAVLFGFALKKCASVETRENIADIAKSVSLIIKWIIDFAPFGIAGIVYKTIISSGLSSILKYGKVLGLLIACMFIVALVIDPLIAGITLRTNPYPLVFKCLKESGLTAFFTRSSAANIPVNMALCERMGLDKDMYSVSIPLGSTINMDGAAITITVMTLATANTLNIHVNFVTAIILSILSALAACGASGVTGGSLLLIPMACSLFGIPDTISMQVVSIGLLINVVQDSFETMLNSSGDVMFAATAEFYQWKKMGKPLPDFMTQK
ncbi:serine/threonine transporter SstT [Lachnobacterium bovis]|uniref:serine/threonine transporter SstT n=1 Tax=Lachnobacterium bovis TaxID=140626 RepID=UPI0004846854|nr:serine/threonine transporter SstT [Lachnobacterium bovis]